MYAAELYNVASTKEEMAAIVSGVIAKTGLDVCADTKAARISGGQSRRLSIALALLKRPTVLFLDEPTTGDLCYRLTSIQEKTPAHLIFSPFNCLVGLDSASAANIMHEIVRIAKEERLIVVCTIHQPSTKVYQSFDQVMVMSKGREAFSGDMSDAVPYFERIGFPCPSYANPAEFFLDLVNRDFTDDAAVESLLDTWQEHKAELKLSRHRLSDVTEHKGDLEAHDSLQTNLFREMQIMLRRHTLLVIRDPILYIGRCFAFLFCNSFFSFIYWNARPFEQEQVVNKLWICIWYCAVATNRKYCPSVMNVPCQCLPDRSQ